jgi:FAD/FMN-containing dehydrogenase
MKLTSWGNYPVIDTKMKYFRSEEELGLILQNTNTLIPRGLGRSYGDSALNDTVVSTLNYNRILQFNERTGELVCEAGVSLEEILEVFVPRGWFLLVTPGTKFVTMGGAVASDIHGKNHHISGSISRHVRWIDVMLPCGKVVRCNKDTNEDLFWATCGGMGLTGIILRICIQLIPISSAYIHQKITSASNLKAIIDLPPSNRSEMW